MADAISDAAAKVDQQKAATLRAMASGDVAGQAALAQGVANTQAARQAAIQGALRQVVGLGAQGPATDAAAKLIAQPYDQRAGTTAALGDAFRQASATRQAGADTYFREAAAAVPVIRAQTDRQLGALRAKNAYESQMHDIQLQLAQGRLAREQAGGGVGRQITDLFGSRAEAQGVLGQLAHGPGTDTTPTGDIRGGVGLANQALGYGLPPDVTEQLMREGAAQAAVQAHHAIRQSPDYGHAMAQAARSAQAGDSYATFLAGLAKNVADPDVRAAIAADAASRYWPKPMGAAP